MTVTDKAFGELVMDLNEFQGLPECKEIRETQWKVTVKPGRALAAQKQIKGPDQKEARDLAKVGEAPVTEPTFSYLSPKVPYEITQIAHLAVTREIVIPIKMKDVFANKNLFVQGPVKELYAHEDYRVFIDFWGYGPMGSKMLIGELELSLVELI